METRQVTQAKMHILALNRMFSKSEEVHIVVASLSKEKIEEFYKDQLAPEPYDDPDDSENQEWKDKVWRKTFKKGSPLEWFNPIDWNEASTYHSEWVPEDQIQNAIAFYGMKSATYLKE